MELPCHQRALDRREPQSGIPATMIIPVVPVRSGFAFVQGKARGVSCTCAQLPSQRIVRRRQRLGGKVEAVRPSRSIRHRKRKECKRRCKSSHSLSVQVHNTRSTSSEYAIHLFSRIYCGRTDRENASALLDAGCTELVRFSSSRILFL